jgi:two-component system nitrate/nitrite response regulator NarL
MQRISPTPVATALIGPDTLVREGLQRILHGTQYRTRHVAETLNGSQHGLPLDLINFTLCSDRGGLLNQVRRVKAHGSTVRIVVMGEGERPDDVWHLLNAGVDGYLSSDSAPAVVLATLNSVMLGGTVVPQTMGRIGPPEAKPASDDDDGSPDVRQLAADLDGKELSAQQTRILLSLMKGQSNKEIARKFDIVEGTVKVHVKAILRKLRVSNRTQAALWGYSHQSALRVPSGGDASCESEWVPIERLAKASARLVAGESLIARQFDAMDSVESNGADTRSARELLALLEENLRIMTAARDALRRTIAKNSA